MFTGIVTAIGEIVRVTPGPVTRFDVRSPYDAETVDLGASISHSGVCLTVVERRREGAMMIHAVEAIPETLQLTSLGALREGSRVNLERALKAGDELGGHIVSGHVDGMGTIRSITPDGGSIRIVVQVPKDLAPMIAKKGSIAIDGVSLTVTEAGADFFEVAIIPHTAQHTTLGTLKPQDRVNLEVDMMARYLARMLAAREG
jgi:riboflavin synthase